MSCCYNNFGLLYFDFDKYDMVEEYLLSLFEFKNDLVFVGVRNLDIVNGFFISYYNFVDFYNYCGNIKEVGE